MKKLAILVMAAMSLSISGLPVKAGLGEATTKSQSSTYDAWCGEKGNDCKVSFSKGKITVNNKHSVDFDDITYITQNDESMWSYRYVYGVEYLEEGMEEPEFAEFIFAEPRTAKRFWRDLRRACRQCKDRDSTQVDVDVNLKD